eukprot:PRCOL_00004261-RA
MAEAAKTAKYVIGMGRKGASPQLIAAGLACGVIGAGTLFHMTRNMKVFGGETPRTMTDEWAKATAAKRSGKALEAGEAVIMDPISRYAYGSK